MADKTVPKSNDTRPQVPDTAGTPLAAAGADYYPRLQEVVNDASAALSKTTGRDYSSEFTAVQFLKNNKLYWVKVSVERVTSQALPSILAAGPGGRRPVRAPQHSSRSWIKQATELSPGQDSERSTAVLPIAPCVCVYYSNDNK